MIIFYTSQFKKDYKRIRKQNKNIIKLRRIIDKLLSEEKLDFRYKDHQLSGVFKNYRDCHIEPDWILIYKKTEKILILERTGSHSELFQK